MPGKINSNYYQWLIIFCIAGLLLFLTMNKHSRVKPFTYQSEIWADKSGYYVYLPAALKFKFNPHNFPDSIDVKTGNSFKLDFENNKVRTKYTSGVALLQLPFFIGADILSRALKKEANGYTVFYHKSINVASVFYLLLGMVLLYGYLKTKFKPRIAILTITSLFLGTNLFFYAIDETGMSHVYSFFLFSTFIYTLNRTKFLIGNRISEAILLGLISGLIVLVRPTNAIFLTSFLFLDANNWDEILIRLKRVFRIKTLLPLAISFFVAILPQLIYWNYLHGSLLYYSYDHEGFDWANPKILQVWFSPNNGLFLYGPMYLLMIMSIIYMIKKGIYNVLFMLIIFMISTYIFSCWWDWSFGCCFGARNYIEYLVLFSIPMAFVFQKINRMNKFKSSLSYFLIFILIAYNLKMIYSFDECLEVVGDWDWDAYSNFLFSQIK